MIHQEADVEPRMSSWGEPVPQPPFFGQEAGDEPAA
jgi:hypothetical protein